MNKHRNTALLAAWFVGMLIFGGLALYSNIQLGKENKLLRNENITLQKELQIARGKTYAPAWVHTTTCTTTTATKPGEHHVVCTTEPTETSVVLGWCSEIDADKHPGISNHIK